jgi:adenine-specific DNA-methyltransferase
LGNYVNGKIYYGIKTGLNEAFVIDEVTKNALIKEDAKSAEIIKPFLAGRDIKRYQPPKSGRYLIFTKRGIDIEKYLAIKNHLSQFMEQLMPKPKNWKDGE